MKLRLVLVLLLCLLPTLALAEPGDMLCRNWMMSDGKWYCKQHDPVAIKAKREAAEQAWRDKWNRLDRIKAAEAHSAHRPPCPLARGVPRPSVGSPSRSVPRPPAAARA